MNGITQNMLLQALRENLDALEDHGIKVCYIVTDAGSVFKSAFQKKLNVTVEKPWFLYGSRKIFVGTDHPHIFKIFRTQFLNGVIKMKSGENFIKLDGYNTFLELLSIDDKGIARAAHKLTYKHIDRYNTFYKMKVKLATQIFSNSVSADIRCCSEEIHTPSSELCASFCQKMNNLFDLLNTRLYHYKDGSSEISPKMLSEQFEIPVSDELTKYQQWLQNDIKISGKSKCSQLLIGSINSVLQFWDEYHNKLKRIDYLETRHLSQDMLELFFARQRRSEKNTSVFSFLRNTSKFCFVDQKTKIEGTNVENIGEGDNRDDPSTPLEYQVQSVLEDLSGADYTDSHSF